eukprot:scaffold1850_cov194-Pinguiococcus_pyrenoidosus.AAC.49
MPHRPAASALPSQTARPRTLPWAPICASCCSAALGPSRHLAPEAWCSIPRRLPGLRGVASLPSLRSLPRLPRLPSFEEVRP